MRQWWRWCIAASLVALFGCSESNPPVAADQLPVDHLPAQLEPLSYNIELYLQPRKDEFTGHVEIDVDVQQAFDRLWLHGAQLKVGTVQVVGGTIATGEWRQHTAEGLASIVFDRTVPVGRSKIILDYSAPYSLGLKGFIRSRDKAAYVASMADGGARYVLPGFDEPRYRAPISLSIDIPSQLDALASTGVINRTELENQRRVVRFAETPALSLGAMGLVVSSFEDPAQARSDHTVVSGYDLDPAPWLQGVEALELRSEYPYPMPKLDVVSLPNVNEVINAAGLIVNPESAPEVQAERLAQHWFDHAAHYRSWQAQCVARGVAKWAGLDAYRNANMIEQSVQDGLWQRALDLDANPLGAMCWDLPSDKVLPLAEVEDHALVAAALLTLEDAKGADIIAEQVWRDWLAGRDTPRGAQDFMPALYQRIYTVLQDGRLMPSACKDDCRYRPASSQRVFSVDEALQDPASVPLSQWRELAREPQVVDLFERITSTTQDIPLLELNSQFGDAWAAAMGDAMARDFERWSGWLRQQSAEATSAEERLMALFALAESTDTRVVSWFQQLFLNRALSPDQSDALFVRLMHSPQADSQLHWLSTNRDKVMRKLSPAQRVRWLDALGGLCSQAQAATVHDAMTPVAAMIFRGEARLKRALARIEACATH